MNKVLAKLLACVMALVVSLALMVMSSYAWLTMSGAPEVDGIQVNIGGSNTILLAANIRTVDENGTVFNYPGTFSDTLSFLGNENYDYLQQVTALLPVSTADGVHWVLPTYYTMDDPEVQQGNAVNGMIKDFSDFAVDTTLANSNMSSLNEQTLGNYIYLDFWVVSPGADYQLRVSTGDTQSNGGSYVIGLPGVDSVWNGYVLGETDQTAASSVRIGFLVNSDWAKSDDVRLWAAGSTYNSRYRSLMGQYQEPGEPLANFSAATNRFTMYEPNGDLHIDPACQGDYLITRPLAVYGSTIYPTDISDRLTVQLTNRWKTDAASGSSLLDLEFSAFLAGQDLSDVTEDSLWTAFYLERLQSQLASYVDRGWFVANTQRLYGSASGDVVDATAAALHTAAGATDDVYITTLRKDTPQRIRMFIWLEGQDADCGNHASVSALTVSLELAGSNDQ